MNIIKPISLDLRPLTTEMRDKMRATLKEARDDPRPKLTILHPKIIMALKLLSTKQR